LGGLGGHSKGSEKELTYSQKIKGPAMYLVRKPSVFSKKGVINTLMIQVERSIAGGKKGGRSLISIVGRKWDLTFGYEEEEAQNPHDQREKKKRGKLHLWESNRQSSLLRERRGKIIHVTEVRLVPAERKGLDSIRERKRESHLLEKSGFGHSIISMERGERERKGCIVRGRSREVRVGVGAAASGKEKHRRADYIDEERKKEKGRKEEGRKWFSVRGGEPGPESSASSPPGKGKKGRSSARSWRGAGGGPGGMRAQRKGGKKKKKNRCLSNGGGRRGHNSCEDYRERR